MKRKKSLVLGLSTAVLLTTIIGISDFKVYADESVSASYTGIAEEDKKSSDNFITAYAEPNEKVSITLRITKRDGDIEPVSIPQQTNKGNDFRYYTYILGPLYANGTIKRNVVLTGIQETENGRGYILEAREPGQLIVRDVVQSKQYEPVDYKVDAPKATNEEQIVTYTLPEVDDKEYIFKKVLENGTEEKIEYDEKNRAVTLTGDERFEDTVVAIYSAGRKGLAEKVNPIKKNFENKEGNEPTLENLLSCLDFGANATMVDKKSTKIADGEQDKLKAVVNAGEHHINVLVKFLDNSEKIYTITINTIANPKKPENNVKPDSSVKPENNVKPDSNAKPDSNTKPDSNAKPENNAKPDSHTKPNNSSNLGNSGNLGGGSSTRGGSGGSGGSSSRGASGSRGGSGSSGRLTKTSTSSTLPSYVVKGGTWSNNNGHWQYKAGNTVYKDMWAAIENPFANEKLGQAKFSWFRFDKDGNMLTNWQWIKDEKDGKVKCYYLNAISNGNLGAMFANTTTPDGYTVNASGEWVINGIVQTK